MTLHTRVAAEIRAERRGILGVEFAEGEAVVRAGEMRHEGGRARIERKRRTAKRAHGIEICAKRGMGIGGGEKARDALRVLAGLLRFLARKIGHAGAGMGVEQEEGLLLLLQMFDDESENGVFHHIGEVAGMIGVAVVHASPRMTKTAAMPPAASASSASAGTVPALRPAKVRT